MTRLVGVVLAIGGIAQANMSLLPHGQCPAQSLRGSVELLLWGDKAGSQALDHGTSVTCRVSFPNEPQVS